MLDMSKRPDNSYEQFSKDFWRGVGIVILLILIFVMVKVGWTMATGEYDCSRYDPEQGQYVCEWR